MGEEGRNSPLEQVSQSLIWPDLEQFQGWSIHNHSGQSGPLPYCCHSKNLFFTLKTHAFIRTPFPAFLWTPIMYWKAAIRSPWSCLFSSWNNTNSLRCAPALWLSSWPYSGFIPAGLYLSYLMGSRAEHSTHKSGGEESLLLHCCCSWDSPYPCAGPCTWPCATSCGLHMLIFQTCQSTSGWHRQEWIYNMKQKSSISTILMVCKSINQVFDSFRHNHCVSVKPVLISHKLQIWACLTELELTSKVKDK